MEGMEGWKSSTSAAASLQQTPTWALATLCFVFIFLSVFMEHIIHLLCHWLKKHREISLFEAVERLKSVLMLLGLMSLILPVTQRPISRICVPNKIAYSMLPCRKSATKTDQTYDYLHNTNPNDHCASKGKTSFISEDGMHELSIFIFVLAVMQIVYSVATMALGRAKMKRWETWEKETQTVEYMAANDPNRFRYTRETTFCRRHMKPRTPSTQLWIKCFFRQFLYSVAKIDYLTLRHGFIMAHLSGKNSFNFQKYIQKSLEEDFKAIVGISPVMWLIVVIFLLVDVHGWNVYLWVSFLPLAILLIVGTKLEMIVARMALQLQDQSTIIQGTPLVHPNDNLFWFNHPRYILTLLHFSLFMNAFEFAFFIWVTWQFGIKSCYHEHKAIIVIRVVLAVMVQVLGGYITLPLYALVTQMGSSFKSIAILENQTMQAIKQWHAEVRVKRKKKLSAEPTQFNSSSAMMSAPCVTTATTILNTFGTIETSDAVLSDQRNDWYHLPVNKSITNTQDGTHQHRQVPSLAEFASRSTKEIIEEVAAQNEPIGLHEITLAPIDVQLQTQDDPQFPNVGINIVR